MVTVSLMPGKVGPAQIRPPSASCPTVGTNYHCVNDEYAMDGTSRHGERGGRKAGIYWDGATQVS
jgi:hypothetical protein